MNQRQQLRQLRQHQIGAIADLYTRMRMRALATQDLYLHPPNLNDQNYQIWVNEVRKALAAQGELWQMPCRSGKTLSALVAISNWQTWLKEWGICKPLREAWAHPHLVLVPTDLVRDAWAKEWAAIAHNTTDAPNAPKMWAIPTMEQKRMQEILDLLRPWDVAVMTYHTLLCRQDIITAKQWHLVVADEVHRLKNNQSAWTQAAYKLKSIFRLGMSATPFTNYIHELRNVLAWLQGWTVGNHRLSAIWPNADHWADVYCQSQYVSARNGAARRIPAGARYPEYLYHKLRAEVMYSATTEEVSAAPDPIIQPLPVPLSARQAEVYARLEDAGSLSRITYQLELCADARLLMDSNMLSLDDWSTEDLSSKLPVLLKILENSAGEQVLVLTAYARLANLLSADLNRLGFVTEALTGDSLDRQGIVSRFAAGETRVVICTRAAWEGISLRAPHVVLYGFVDHTPGMVKQALLRAWNMFDRRPVMVYDLYAPGTVEAWNRHRLQAKDSYATVMTNGQDTTLFPPVPDLRKS